MVSEISRETVRAFLVERRWSNVTLVHQAPDETTRPCVTLHIPSVEKFQGDTGIYLRMVDQYLQDIVRQKGEGTYQAFLAESDLGHAIQLFRSVSRETVMQPCQNPACVGRARGLELGVALDATEKWPGIRIISVDGTRYREGDRGPVGYVTFFFPGGRWPVEWYRGDRVVQVCQSDKMEWRRYRSRIGLISKGSRVY